MRKLLTPLLFIVFVVGWCFYFNYWDILFWRPRGIHFMRQTDSLSFISFYLKTGAGLFSPGGLTLYSYDGKTASEFPILYYLLSFVWKVFGRQEFLLRATNMLIVFTGIYHFWRWGSEWIQNRFTALALVAIVFSGPFVLYYMNNFLPDIAAMGFTFIGLRFAMKHLELNESRHGIKAMAWMGFASLLKVSYFIYPFALLLCLFFLKLLYKSKIDKKTVLTFLLAAIAVVSWNLYVRYYNNIHNGYFLSTIRPIWSLDTEHISSTLQLIREYWRYWYYPGKTYMLFGVAFVGFLVLMKKTPAYITVFITACICGLFVYSLLFFAQFHDHDYYMLAFIPTAALMLIHLGAGLHKLVKQRPKAGWVITFGFVVFAGMCLQYGQTKLVWRYWESEQDIYARTGVLLDGADTALTQAGIPEDAKIIVMPDHGYSGATYFTNRFGWNLSNPTPQQLERIPEFIAKGASYALIMDTLFSQHPGIQPYLKTEVYTTKNYTVYALKD